MYNIEKFCNEANITVADMDADFWLALDRGTRVELVRCWWLDHDDEGYTSMTGATACAEFFGSKQNSIRGLQTEAFQGMTAPWQKGYESNWRVALKFLEEASITPEQVKQGIDAVIQLVTSGRVEREAVTQNIPLRTEEGRQLRDALAVGPTLSDYGIEPGADVLAHARQVEQEVEQGLAAAEQRFQDKLAALVPDAPKSSRRERTWFVEDGVFKSKQGPECLIYACPACGAGAYDHDTLMRGFGVRVNKDTGRAYPQTWCRACKGVVSKKARADKNQTKTEPQEQGDHPKFLSQFLTRARQELRDYVGQRDCDLDNREHVKALKIDLEDAIKYLRYAQRFEEQVKQLNDMIDVAPDGLPSSDDVRAFLDSLPSEVG